MLCLLLPGVASAITCTKGCRCGNACISCHETCHKGSSAGTYEEPGSIPGWLIVAGVLVLVGGAGFAVYYASHADADESDEWYDSPTWNLEPSADGVTVWGGLTF